MKNNYFLIGLLALLLCTGCSSPRNIHSMTFSGTVEMTEHSVGMPVPGRIEKIFVEEEQSVTKGQLIGLLEHYDQAKKDFARSQALVGSGGVSKQEFEHDRQAMEDQQAVAPVDGIVLVKVRETGEVVPAGAPIIIVGEINDMWVKVFIPEDLISQVRVKQKAIVRVDGLDQKINGHVRSIATNAEFTPRNIQTPEERATQTFAVKVALDEDQLRLHPGVTADVYFQ